MRRDALVWHDTSDLPNPGEVVIAEIWGRNGRTNLVGYALYSDGVWDFTPGGFRIGIGEHRTPDVCRWARFPPPSWVEP